MDKKLFDAICEFCEYITDWEEKKQDYINDILPDLKYGYSPKEIKSEARIIFNEKIRTLTNPYPSIWNNIVDVIVQIKENPKEFERTELGEKYKRLFDNLRKKYNFQGFVHTTSFENFINIMKSKYIYSRNYVIEHNIKTHDIALDDVIEKTSDKIKDYVRFYWRVKTPTNYDNEGIKPKAALTGNFKAHSPNPVILIMDDRLALNDKTRFTPINACKCSHLFTHELCEDKTKYPFNYDFEKIFHDKPILEDDDKQAIINARHAELLYPNFVSIDKIKKIIFRSKADYNRAVLKFGANNKFEINSQLFWNNWVYVKDYILRATDSTISLKIEYYLGNCFYNKYNILDLAHTILFLDKDMTKIDNIDVNNYFNKPYNLYSEFCFKNKPDYKYICYYIDNIECIKARIND